MESSVIYLAILLAPLVSNVWHHSFLFPCSVPKKTELCGSLEADTGDRVVKQIIRPSMEQHSHSGSM